MFGVFVCNYCGMMGQPKKERNEQSFKLISLTALWRQLCVLKADLWSCFHVCVLCVVCFVDVMWRCGFCLEDDEMRLWW